MKWSTSLALGAIAFLGVTHAAQAADLTVPEPIETSYGPAGLYIGGGIGRTSYDRDYDLGDSEVIIVCTDCGPVSTIEVLTAPLEESELTFHILAGYLFRTGPLGIGIEADYTFADDTPWGLSGVQPTSGRKLSTGRLFQLDRASGSLARHCWC